MIAIVLRFDLQKKPIHISLTEYDVSVKIIKEIFELPMVEI